MCRSEPSYRIPVARDAPNTNHSHHAEILKDVLRLVRGEVEGRSTPESGDVAAAAAAAAAAAGLAGLICVGCEVTSVQKEATGGWRVTGASRTLAVDAPPAPFEVRCGTVVVCTNRRLGVPRSLTLRGEGSFLGEVRRGLAGDIESVKWRGQRVVILGMGAFAIENMRTARRAPRARRAQLCTSSCTPQPCAPRRA